MSSQANPRSDRCPLCDHRSAQVLLELRFNHKMGLPTEARVRHCAADNFLFTDAGSQRDYDVYYAAVANDTYHGELSGESARSPISALQAGLLKGSLGDFFRKPRRVLDFGCGEARLLVELASQNPTSTFLGFDPGPAARTGSQMVKMLGLGNVSICRTLEGADSAPYHLAIASHVTEHLLDFEILESLRGPLTEHGLLYLEVPDALSYGDHQRLEFLYYFDRLHVNHFSPQSLAQLAAQHGFGYVSHFQYAFPYRDGGRYPALGMLLRKGGDTVRVRSQDLLQAAARYIERERSRAGLISAELEALEGVLAWGAGDNFFRSMGNGGPLSGLKNMVVLDRRPQEISVAGRTFRTMEPEEGIRRYRWPVVVTVSEGRQSIGRQVAAIDPSRRVLFA